MGHYKVIVSQTVKIRGEYEVTAESCEDAVAYIKDNWPEIDEICDWDYVPDSWIGEPEVEHAVLVDDYCDF